MLKTDATSTMIRSWLSGSTKTGGSTPGGGAAFANPLALRFPHSCVPNKNGAIMRWRRFESRFGQRLTCDR